MVAIEQSQLHREEATTKQQGLRPGDAVGALFDAAGLPPRRAYGARAWCFRQGGKMAAVAKGQDLPALADALLEAVTAPEGSEVASGRWFQDMSGELGLKLAEELRLRKALKASVRESTTSPSAIGNPVALKLSEGPTTTQQQQSPGPAVAMDAVGALFDAAGLPQRRAYGARAWCFRRGGRMAAAARGQDPQALVDALLEPVTAPEEAAVASSRCFQEMSGELGLKRVEELRLRKALEAPVREGTASPCAVGGAVAALKLEGRWPAQRADAALATSMLVKKMAAAVVMSGALKRDRADFEDVCKAMKTGPGPAAKKLRPSPVIMAATAA